MELYSIEMDPSAQLIHANQVAQPSYPHLAVIGPHTSRIHFPIFGLWNYKMVGSAWEGKCWLFHHPQMLLNVSSASCFNPGHGGGCLCAINICLYVYVCVLLIMIFTVYSCIADMLLEAWITLFLFRTYDSVLDSWWSGRKRGPGEHLSSFWAGRSGVSGKVREVDGMWSAGYLTMVRKPLFSKSSSYWVHAQE